MYILRWYILRCILTKESARLVVQWENVVYLYVYVFIFVMCNCSHAVVPSNFAIPTRQWLGEHSCVSSAFLNDLLVIFYVWISSFHLLINVWVHIWYILQCLFHKCLCNICAVCFLLLFPWFVIFRLFKSILFFVN